MLLFCSFPGSIIFRIDKRKEEMQILTCTRSTKQSWIWFIAVRAYETFHIKPLENLQYKICHILNVFNNLPKDNNISEILNNCFVDFSLFFFLFSWGKTIWLLFLFWLGILHIELLHIVVYSLNKGPKPESK